MAAIMITVLCGFVSLGVDLGRVQVAKAELQTAADAAARAAANALASGVSTAQQAAQGAAGENTCDGVAVVLTPATDLSFGSWNASTKTFTAAASGQEATATALKVSLRRTSTNGIPLKFGAVLGKSTCDISATSIVTVTATGGGAVGFIGLNGLDFWTNTDFASYKSSVTTYPTTCSGSKCIVKTNGTLSAWWNAALRGDLTLGPNGSTWGTVYVTGSRIRLASPVVAPALPAWAPGSNPNGISQNYWVSHITTLPGGTYWFTSLNIDNNLSFSGPATIYVNGSVRIDSDLTAYNRIPANLRIYVLGSNRTFGDSWASGVDIVAVILAPGANADFSFYPRFYGSAVFNSISARSYADFYYDETLGSTTSTTTTISVVK